MSDTTYPPEAWERLGRAARERRISLGMSQPDVSASGGPSTGVISKIENAKQDSYEDRVLAQLERALQWKPGSAKAVLAGGEPLPVGDPASPHAGGRREEAATSTREAESPIATHLQELLAQAQQRTEEKIKELVNQKFEEQNELLTRQNELIEKLLNERKGA